MQNPDTISRRDAATRGWPGASSHQLRLEINRRQMRRVAGRAPSFPPSPCLADFSHPLPTIRLFSTNTKRYTRPTTPPPLYIYTLLEFLQAFWISPLYSPKYAFQIDTFIAIEMEYRLEQLAMIENSKRE